MILKIYNYSLIILLQLKSIAQCFPYYHHENMEHRDDVLSQNPQVMEIGNFQVKKGNPPIHQQGED